MRRFVLILAILLSVPVTDAGAEWQSFVVNFDKSDYGKGPQTWQVSPYDGRWTYFANNNGILQFDGKDWDVFPLNNMLDARSVKVSEIKERIYVGGINEFGYFEPDSQGLLKYNCMSDSVGNEFSTIGNVWSVHETDNLLFFVGDNDIVKYVDDKATKITTGKKIDCSAIANDILYIGTDAGVFFLAGNTFFPLQGCEDLVSCRIRGILPYGDGVLIVTAYDGIFLYKGHRLSKIVTGVEDFLRKNEVFCAAVSGNKLAIGTIHKGVIVVNLVSDSINYINESTGLRNNTVLSLAFDVVGNLWAGLDNGIDYICLNLPFGNMYAHTDFLGSGYCAAVYDGLLYLGTNRGLYCTAYPVNVGENPPEFIQVANSSGQVWSVDMVDNQLLCFHDRGIFVVEGERIRRITSLTGVWGGQPVSGRNGQMYVGTYNGLYLLEKQEGEWNIVHRVEGFNSSCRVFAQETDRVLWVDNSDRVIRMELNDSLTEVLGQREYRFDTSNSVKNHINISKINDRICFPTPDGIYRYDSNLDSMVHDADLNNRLNGKVQYLCLHDNGSRIVGLNNYEIYISNHDQYRKGTNLQVIQVPRMLIELVPDYESIVFLSDSLMILPNENGFAVFNLALVPEYPGFDKSLYIKNMYLTHGVDSLVYTANYLSRKPVPVINYSHNSVRFDYNITSFQENEMHYQYRLNDEPWSDYSRNSSKEYTDLREGEYTFHVRAFFHEGTISQDSISFRILPPWYRTVWSYLVYVFLFFAGMFALYRLYERLLKINEQRAVIEKNREISEMEKAYEREKAETERQIMQLEKEKLEHDLQYKNQEMTNLMINVMRKNEMLTEIKSDIIKAASNLKGRGASESYNELLLINSKIDSNIRSDELLKRIEKQFDLLHNNFMTRLHEKHPNLSHSERMMCAYLIMNLSSKEIAPLLNISVRGVETIRYRLRKKMELEHEDNLVDYLTNRL